MLERLLLKSVTCISFSENFHFSNNKTGNMQTVPKESLIMPVASMYYKNSPVMKMVDCIEYSNRKSTSNFPQKVASHLITPANVHYMCTGDKFVPISTNMSLLELSSDKINTDNIIHQTAKNQSMPPTSLNIKPKAWFLPSPIPLKKTNTQNEKNIDFNGSNFNSSKKYNYEKQAIMDNQESRKSVLNILSQKVYFTGTIERILRWNRNLKDMFCLYETTAPVISIQEGRISHQKIMLLRDRMGPILQVQYFASTHIDINDFHIGQYLRCVGRMIGMNILSAESIREANEEEILNMSRLTYVCDYSVNHNMNKE